MFYEAIGNDDEFLSFNKLSLYMHFKQKKYSICMKTIYKLYITRFILKTLECL